MRVDSFKITENPKKQNNGIEILKSTNILAKELVQNNISKYQNKFPELSEKVFNLEIEDKTGLDLIKKHSEDKISNFLLSNISRINNIIVNIQTFKKTLVEDSLKKLIEDMSFEIFSVVCDNIRLEYEINLDTLTSLPNRRAFNKKSEYEIARCKRNGPLSFLILDLDKFKNINDRYGHQVGDQVLIETSRRLRGTKRDVDFIARWGGEEIAMVFPNTSGKEACIGAQRLLDAIKLIPFNVIGDNGENIQLNISASIGVAEYIKSELHNVNSDTGDLVLGRADKCLYITKGEIADKNGVRKNRRGSVSYNDMIFSREDILAYKKELGNHRK